MAINFPDSPNNGDSFTSNNKTWVFDGTVWNITSGTNSVADGAITAAKIDTGAVTAAKIASDAVTTAKILDANITTAKIASDAVTTAKILDANVTEAKIASDAVTTAKILDANVTAAKLASDAVTQAKIADRAVGSAELTALTLNTQTGTTYTLVLTDAHDLVTLNNASAITLTIPTNSSVAFTIGDQVNLLQLGAGQVTVGGAGVTIRSQGSKLKLNGQYSAVTCIKIGTDEWVLVGNTAS